MSKHHARAGLLSNLVSGATAIALGIAVMCVAVFLPMVLYNHDIFGDAAGPVRVPVEFGDPPLNLVAVTRGSGRNRRTVHILRALVRPLYPVEEEGGPGQAFPDLPLPDTGPGGEEEDTDDWEQAGVLDAGRYGREPPGNYCPWWVPGPFCRLYEDWFRSDAWAGSEADFLPLTMEFGSDAAARLALDKVQRNQFVLRDEDSGELFLLSSLPSSSYFAVMLPLAVAAGVLACSSWHDKVTLWGASNADTLLPQPTRVWMAPFRRYLWLLHPVSVQLLPHESAGAVLQGCAAVALAVSVVLQLDFMARFQRCGAAADCAVPTAGYDIPPWLFSLALLGPPIFSFVIGRRAAFVGQCVDKAQVGFVEHFQLPPAQNVAWPVGHSRRVFIKHDVKAGAPIARVGPGEAAPCVTVQEARVDLCCFRTFVNRQGNRNNTQTDLHWSESHAFPDLAGARVPAGTPIVASAEVTMPEHVTLSSVPGQDKPFYTWYLRYTVELAGMGQDSLLLPMHVVPPLVTGAADEVLSTASEEEEGGRWRGGAAH